MIQGSQDNWCNGQHRGAWNKLLPQIHLLPVVPGILEESLGLLRTCRPRGRAELEGLQQVGKGWLGTIFKDFRIFSRHAWDPHDLVGSSGSETSSERRLET